MHCSLALFLLPAAFRLSADPEKVTKRIGHVWVPVLQNVVPGNLTGGHSMGIAANHLLHPQAIGAWPGGAGNSVQVTQQNQLQKLSALTSSHWRLVRGHF